MPYAATLLLLHVAMVWLSCHFAYDLPLREQPILAFVMLCLVTGGVFVSAVLRFLSAQCFPGRPNAERGTGNRENGTPRYPEGTKWSVTLIGSFLGRGAGDSFFAKKESPAGLHTGRAFLFMLLVGLGMRACMMLSQPVLEYDFHRYLWDGAVCGQGMNPYAYSPGQVLSGGTGIPPVLTALAAQSGEVIQRISFPELRTIYPPVSQLGFAAACLLSPWSLTAWRAVLAVCDAATLLLIVTALRRLNQPRVYALIYWWNPLVVFEIYNTAHVDAIALPLAMGAILLAAGKRHLPAAATLALAVGAKLWPVVLLPWVLCGVWRKPGQFAAVLGIFVLVVTALVAPILMSGIDPGSGLVAYGRNWEMNDGLFRLVRGGVAEMVTLVGGDPRNAPLLARIACGVLLAALIGVMLKRRGGDGPDLWDGGLMSVAALFLLSPTSFPWYYLWVVPFLAVRPRVSLLLLNLLLMLYYLVYWCRAADSADLFDGCVVWLEYVPFWVALAVEMGSRKRFFRTVG